MHVHRGCVHGAQYFIKSKAASFFKLYEIKQLTHHSTYTRQLLLLRAASALRPEELILASAAHLNHLRSDSYKGVVVANTKTIDGVACHMQISLAHAAKARCWLLCV